MVYNHPNEQPTVVMLQPLRTAQVMTNYCRAHGKELNPYFYYPLFIQFLSNYLSTGIFDGQRLALSVQQGTREFLDKKDPRIEKHFKVVPAAPSTEDIWGLVQALAGNNEVVIGGARRALFGS